MELMNSEGSFRTCEIVGICTFLQKALAVWADEDGKLQPMHVGAYAVQHYLEHQKKAHKILETVGGLDLTAKRNEILLQMDAIRAQKVRTARDIGVLLVLAIAAGMGGTRALNEWKAHRKPLQHEPVPENTARWDEKTHRDEPPPPTRERHVVWSVPPSVMAAKGLTVDGSDIRYRDALIAMSYNFDTVTARPEDGMVIISMGNSRKPSSGLAMTAWIAAHERSLNYIQAFTNEPFADPASLQRHEWKFQPKDCEELPFGAERGDGPISMEIDAAALVALERLGIRLEQKISFGDYRVRVWKGDDIPDTVSRGQRFALYLRHGAPVIESIENGYAFPEGYRCIDWTQHLFTDRGAGREVFRRKYYTDDRGTIEQGPPGGASPTITVAGITREGLRKCGVDEDGRGMTIVSGKDVYKRAFGMTKNVSIHSDGQATVCEWMNEWARKVKRTRVEVSQGGAVTEIETVVPKTDKFAMLQWAGDDRWSRPDSGGPRELMVNLLKKMQFAPGVSEEMLLHRGMRFAGGVLQFDERKNVGDLLYGIYPGGCDRISVERDGDDIRMEITLMQKGGATGKSAWTKTILLKPDGRAELTTRKHYPLLLTYHGVPNIFKRNVDFIDNSGRSPRDWP